MNPFLSTASIVTIPPRFRSMLSALPGWLEKLLPIVLCWQLAGLFWVFFAPATQDVKLLMPRQSADNAVVSRDAFLGWYGGNATAQAPEEFSLMAVIAGRNGAAVLKKGDGSSVALRAGAEISPGNKLLAVEPEQITIERSGVERVLKLPQKSSPALFADVDRPSKKALPAIKMTRGQMAGIIQGGNLAAWDKGLSSVPDGGIRVDNAATQPLARMLQFKNGDILKSINGRRLDQLADSSLLFHFFGQQSSVDVVVVRDGATLTLHYEIQP
jgi:general secretion pathway protein C